MFFADVENTLKILDQVQVQCRIADEASDSLYPKVVSYVNNDLNTLLSVLSNPVFSRLCKIHVSIFPL